MTNFAHLHCHTDYSFLDGTIKIPELCAKTNGLGMMACAITDHGNMYGALDFYLECKKHDIKPIIGLEAYICMDHKNSPKEERYHLTLLAESDEGYKNLMTLSSLSYKADYFYRKPRIDWALLEKYSRGLIVLSGCISGEISKAILTENMDIARRVANFYKKTFPDRFFLEVQKNGLPEQDKVNLKLQELSESEKIQLVATNDCHYLDKSDCILTDISICISTHKRLSDPDRLRIDTKEFYFKSAQKMRKDFMNLPTAFANACEIASRCNVEIQTDRHFFPIFDLPQEISAEEKLEDLAMTGLSEKGLATEEMYIERLKSELETINKMGYAGYFLIVHDIVKFARSKSIPVGPGRGSAAGSLVAFSLDITGINPIRHGLIFERFLNPERVSLPDIDIDFCPKRRGEIITYLKEKFGEDHVARIPAFSKMQARAAIKDVGRVMGLEFTDSEKLSKLVPQGQDTTLKEVFTSGSLAGECKKNPSINQVIELAIRCEGTTRHASVHAAGVILSDKPVSERCPTWIKDGEILIQYDGPMAEKAGLVKFDLLGLSTLSIIKTTLNHIERQGKPVPILDDLPLDDPKVYDALSRGETKGIFQVEGDGLTNYMSRLKPNSFEDLVAMLALYRPGPMKSGMVDEFICRKHGEKAVTYPHETLEDLLKETYGVIVYQEQVMTIAQIIAGYTLGQADILRRAMGKKKAEEMAAERENFIKGAQEKGIDKAKANEIFDIMEKFAEYGFNKSHSAAYALLTYWTAWLKIHYTCEFIAALLTEETKDDKKQLYVAEGQRLGITILPPNINLSEIEFTPENKQIRWGLSAIKRLGNNGVKEILDKRKDGYESLGDFCSRVSKKTVSEAAVISLICAGAFDSFDKSRKSMLNNLKKIRDSKKPMDFMDCKEYPKETLLQKELDSLGVYLSGHPLDGVPNVAGCKTLSDCENLKGTATVVIQVLKVKKKKTKHEEPMASIDIQDKTKSAQLVIWSDIYETIMPMFKTNAILKITVKPSKYKGFGNTGLHLVCVNAEEIQ